MRLVALLIVDYSASRRLVVDYFASAVHPGAPARRAARHAACRTTRRRLLCLAQARRRLLRLCHATGCLGPSRGSSRGSSRRSSSTTPPRVGSSSTISLPPRVRVPRHAARLVTWLVALHIVDYSASRRLVVDYFASAAHLGASARHAARRAARHRLPASRRLVVDYFASAARPGASARRVARHAARHAAHRRLLRLAQARRRLLCLCRMSECLGTSRGSSRGLSHHSSSTTLPRAGMSSTTSPMPRDRVPQPVARLVAWLVAPLVVDYSTSRRLVVDNFASAARPSASARRAARHVACRAAHRRLLCLAQARRRLLRLRRASGCLGTSRSSSRRSSSTTPPRAGSSSTTSLPPHVRVPRHVVWLVTRLVAPLIVDYSASCRLVVDYFASAACPGASARRAARHADCRTTRRRLLCLAQARRRLLRLCHATGCLGPSRGSLRCSSRHSSLTTPPRAGSSSTTSLPPHVGVPRHVASLVTRLVAPLIVDYSASRRLVVDYLTYAVRPGASTRRTARHAARRAARRRLLHLVQARR
jgi:hypothetical protein